MKMILSTLTSAQSVVITEKSANGALHIVKRIHINGGANVADRKTLITPQGVVTELTDEDYALLITTDFYKRQERAGFLRPVESKDAAEDTKKAGMKKRDKSSQKTEADYKDSDVKVKTGKPKDDED